MGKDNIEVIGGYFELELPPSNKEFINSNGFFVNSGQNALEYIFRNLGSKVKKVFLPYYTCDVVLNTILRLGLDYRFYHINDSLEISEYPDLKDGEYIIVNNYFGLKDQYINDVFLKYKYNLIVDNAQAWYASIPSGARGIYSPRKFFGVPDGGIAIVNDKIHAEMDREISYNKSSYLLKRIDLGAENGYEDFKRESKNLANEPIKRISSLSHRILSSIDYENIREKRITNYLVLHEALKKSNNLTLPNMKSFKCPMIYPYLNNNFNLRKILIDNKIFVATYWPNVFNWCNSSSIECYLAQGIIPLPIDQRYDKESMYKIIDLINNNY